MRLIDADALMETMRENSEGNEGWYGDTLAFMRDVENAPTIDAVPVRHEDDGTLWVTVEDCEKVGRVIIKNEQGHFCRVFYMGDGDEEPVRHGRWLEYGENKDGTHNIRCSKCGAGLKSKGHANSYYTKRKYRYCPNCGAKMDGEDDE